MTIDNNLNAMVAAQMQVNQNAQNIASVGAAVGSSELQEVSQELIDSIVGQIPEVISYEANAKGIQTQNAVSDTFLNLKA
ncbi:hypothetical protein GCM10012288_04330 [Malaciobacter pacificus]|uniref:Uncharacterized protein n=1 Tax=Malaciobacter pacificus TaxID=1080223 RepID=A0A5C2H6J0_9BACT|nr:hypothetical protein [Malaciobacter pacificus]QEP34567.1 hypothetical protein APAC_1458 [Malaciobacter pacificus]GGD33549.1 hypothetical protein GCM10012288_04330 [Malaciobacter pacificus]